VKSQEALERIRRGVHEFQTNIFPSKREMFAKLAGGQDPLALFITCADSRIVPNLFTQTGPGELFAERNPGNLVPHHEAFIGGVSASVEYAMLALKVPLAIVCGHTDCGVMKGLLHPEAVDHLPAVRDWMRHAKAARARVLREYAGASEPEQLQRLTEYNVLLQMENLKTHPSVRARLDAGDLDIRGWVYDIGSGSGWDVNPASSKFEPFDWSAKI
jgi:carbonic anhydrase